MGMTAALKLRTIVENAERLFAIELLAAGTALEYRRPLKSRSRRGTRAREHCARSLPPLDDDRAMYAEIERVAEAIRTGEFDSEMEQL